MNTSKGDRRFNRVAGLAGLIAAMLVSACAGKATPPVVDRGQHAGGARVQTSTGRTQPVAVRPVTSGQYRVSKGDTLYSIAFRYGRDWKELAAANGIAEPYTIRPGQVIDFSRKTPGRQTAVVAPAGRSPAAQPVARPATTTPPASSASRQPAAAQKPAVQAKPVTPAKPAATVAGGKWQWPAQGTVVSRFSSSTSLNKGIDIAGKLGQPVVSAAAGTVVYAGSDLRGYGDLVIIKHDDTFISAYGHNRRLLVNEGQQVRAGAQIAEMGSTGTDQVKLHFEIRRQGNPVDPLLYLPRK